MSSAEGSIDMDAEHSLSAFIRKRGLSIEEAVHLLRDESSQDTRPNKALNPQCLGRLLDGYPHLSVLQEIALHGIKPNWFKSSQPRQSKSAINHRSFVRHLSAALKSIRDGQVQGKFLVVDADLLERWSSVHCSPFGAVEKSDVDPDTEVRVIHDLSFPAGYSTNDNLDKDCLPDINYEYVIVLAIRIEFLVKKFPNCIIRILKGDLKGAFRHLMTHAQHVRWMAGLIRERNALVIDLAAPFGWSGYPKFYAAFGQAISWLVAQNSPASVADSDDTTPFFAYEWVDDHILIEVDIENRLELAEATLRPAMLAILGPRSINEAKFSGWSTRLKALGLVWDTVHRTLSIPEDKIDKGIARIDDLLTRGLATKNDLEKIIGSLRYITLCLRSAKPFFQNLQFAMLRWPRFGQGQLQQQIIDDLKWFRYILNDGHLAELPLRMFGSMPQPDCHLYMDASDLGLAVLNPGRKEFIRVQFDTEEQTRISNGQFSINVREHLCMALALWTWYQHWESIASNQVPHVRFWSDNASAVAWCNKLSSLCTTSQEINRAIGLGEAVFNIRISAAHLPGSTNTMADAASRSWTEPYSATWSNFSVFWKQVPVPQVWRKVYKTFSTNCRPNLWPHRRQPSTRAHGSSGCTGVNECSYNHGYQRTERSTPISSRYSQSSVGDSALEHRSRQFSVNDPLQDLPYLLASSVPTWVQRRATSRTQTRHHRNAANLGTKLAKTANYNRHAQRNPPQSRLQQHP